MRHARIRRGRRAAFEPLNPWFRLLVSEVEALVRDKYGDEHLKQVRARSELVRIERELKRLATEVSALEERRASLRRDLHG